MRVVCISDTHNQHERLIVPECDILVHAGDATNSGTCKELDRFWAWMGCQPAKHKVFVPGNHDIACQKVSWRPSIVYGIHTLVDQTVELDGVQVFGSPWQPAFCDWAYNLPRNQHGLRNKWRDIPEDTQILVTHGPAFGCLDDSKGCEFLASRLANGLPDLALHVFGHIHEGAGERIGRFTSVNATMAYLPGPRDPVVIDLA